MQIYASKVQLVSVTVDTAAKTLRQLLEAVSGYSLPTGVSLLQVIITPAAAVSITDAFNAGTYAFSAAKTIPCCNCLDNIQLSCASSTVSTVIELYFGD